MINHFTCRNCKELTPIKNAKKGTVTGKGTGLCKKCHSDYSYQYQLRLKAELETKTVLCCNDCDKYFSKYKIGGTRLLKTKCPYCSSDEIEYA